MVLARGTPVKQRNLSIFRHDLPNEKCEGGSEELLTLAFAGTIGLFLTLFLVFARFLPMIAISEVKGVLAVQRHTFKREEVAAK